MTATQWRDRALLARAAEERADIEAERLLNREVNGDSYEKDYAWRLRVAKLNEVDAHRLAAEIYEELFADAAQHEMTPP